MQRRFNVAVIGATGAVGREVLSILAERQFPVGNIYAVASKNSIGKKVSFGTDNVSISTLEGINFKDIDLIFSSSGEDVTRQFIEEATSCGCVVIDKTSLFRLDPSVPLLIPEVNLSEIVDYKNKNIIANPNCCVIPIAMALKPLDSGFKVRRVVISTYQSVSGAGMWAMDALYHQTKDRFVFKEEDASTESDYKERFAFNVIPQIGDLSEEDGCSDEEKKIALELQRILGAHIKISVTSVRVPVFIGHCFSINVELENDTSLSHVKKALSTIHGLKLSAQPVTPASISGTDEVFVSRIRQDYSRENCFNMWIATDNLRKGAALNAVQIAERLAKHLCD